MLTLRPTGLSSPAYRDWLDYVIVEDGRDVGRLYEDRQSHPELRWFWSITVYVDPKLGITLKTLAEARAYILKLPEAKQTRWEGAVRCLLQAAESGSAEDIKAATRAIELAFLYQGQLPIPPKRE